MRDKNNRGIRILAAVLFGLASLISIYLLVKKLTDGPIAGCGPGSGCSKVLGSSFAYFVPGIPVTAPAIIVYFTLIFGLLSRAKGARAEAWEIVMYVGALIVIGSAVWFTGMQAFFVKQFCGWCMAAHILGGVGSIIILAKMRPSQKELAIIGVGVAGLALGSMAAFQYFWKQKTTHTAQYGPGLGSGKIIPFGPLNVRLGDVPFRGNPDSTKRVALIYDYTCGYCRRTHKFMQRAEERYGKDNYLVVMLPTPLHPNCNRHFEEEIPSHRHACAIASIAMAIWWTDPEKFYEFDHWVIEAGTNDEPPDIVDVRAKAEELVGKDVLEKALENKNIAKQLEMNVEIFHGAQQASKRKQMPKMIMSNGTVVTGMAENEFELYKILEEGMGVKRLK